MLPEGVRRPLRLLRGPKDVPRDVDEEIRFHLDEKVAALVAHGMSPDAARAEALRQFGDVGATRKRLVMRDGAAARARAAAQWAEGVAQDLRTALRALARAPGLTATVVLILGLGIGGASAMFGLLDRLLLSVGPHIESPGTLRRVYTREFDDYHEKAWIYRSTYSESQIARLAAVLPAGARLAALASARDRLGGRGGPQTPIVLVSGQALDVLGVTPEAGRLLTPADDRVGAEPAAVIGHGLWRRHFGGDPEILGRTLLLGTVRYTIVGVMPRGFSGLRPNRVEAWVPMQVGGEPHLGRGGGDWWRRGAWRFDVVLRLPAGADERLPALAIERAMRAGLAESRRDTNVTVTLESVLPWQRPGGLGTAAQLSLVVAGVAGVLCVIAVANATNLLLLRATQRRRETAVRLALGIGRTRLVRGVVVESTMLALAGSAVAGAVAAWGGALLQKLIVQGEWQRGLLDTRVLGFSGGLALVIGLVTGLVPGWQASRPDAVAALKVGSRGGGSRSRLRVALLVVQAAFTVVLLAGLGVYTRSFLRARATEYGLAADRLVNMNLELAPEDSAAPPGHLAGITTTLIERLRSMPGVTGVSLTSGTPVYSYGGEVLRVEGVDRIQMDSRGPFITEIDSAFLDVTDLLVVRGRQPTGAEFAARVPVAMVNQAFVDKWWPGQEPLGKCLYVGSVREAHGRVCRQVVGVVSNYRNRLQEEGWMQQYYLPFGFRGPGHDRGYSLIVRTAGPPDRLTPQLLAILRELLPASEPEAVMAIGDIVRREEDPWRAGTTLFALFAGLAVVLAMGGMYSLVAFSVAQRTHEFGVRIAVGARAHHLVTLVLATVLRPVAAGVGLGAGLALWLVGFLGPLLYQTEPRDPLVLAAGLALLLAIAALACVAPARAATRTDPRIALQAE